MTDPQHSRDAVWRDLTQAELDRAYDQAAYAANMQSVVARFQTNSAAARQRLAPPDRIAYGPGEKSAFDLYRAAGDRRPLQIFVHGGAWRATAAADYAFLAECFTGAGAHLAILDFDWVQDRGGDLTSVADQISTGVQRIIDNAVDLNADPARIFLSGHSSGAHMAAVALTRLAGGVAGAFLASGMYDLAPVSLSARSAYVAFTEAGVAALSPIRHMEKIGVPVVAAYGSLETPEFVRQSEDFATEIRQAGGLVELIVGMHYNHFEILETLANPYGLLGRAALRQMGLGGR